MSNDGGPAYPARRPDWVQKAVGTRLNPDGSSEPIFRPEMAELDYPGMSLRDWFAGQALVGIMGPNYDWFTSGSSETGSRTYEAAFFAYGLADAMLAARNSTPTKET